MIDVQLYIDKSSDDNQEYAKVDLFEDESMTLISSIQDIKDFSKIFADYSRTFKIPANDRNNKLFKHFYNPDVKGFNGATKKLAKIHLNYMPFREGYIYLQSTEMKNNKAASYTIIFYGGLIKLREALKEEKLTALVSNLDSDLERLTYNSATVKEGLTNGLFGGDIIYPLITSEKRLYHDSSSASPNYDGNIYHDSVSPDSTRGVAYTDLKPAIKVTKLIEAIESKYTLSFTGFFDTTPLDNLYLWLSRESGEIINYGTSGEISNSKSITEFTASSAPTDSNLTIVDDTWTFTQDPWTSDSFDVIRYESEFNITISAGSYDNVVLKAIDEITGDVIAEKSESGGNQTITLISNPNYQNPNVKNAEPRTYRIRWEVESFGGSITFTSGLTLRKKVAFETLVEDTYNAFDGLSSTTLPEQDLVNHLPDIKVIDFLSGLFRVFNLTAYVQEPLASVPVIEVRTLDDYYADAVNNQSKGTIDIVDFVDVESHEIELARPFANVSFEYKKTDTALMAAHEATHNKVFGNTIYSAPDEYDSGVDYKVEVPFSHLKYERLFDIGVTPTSENENLTDIQWGYAAGGSFKHEDSTTEKSTPTGNYSPKKIEPLLFYGINQTISDGNGINWISDSVDEITTYWRPSNSNEEGTPTTPPANSLNFDTEFDEWQLKVYRESDSDLIVADNSLFGKYYINYISGAYNESKRIFRYKCFLPAKILVRYKLNDQIKIHDRLFRINSIKTNLKTGATEIELLNLIPTLDNII